MLTPNVERWRAAGTVREVLGRRLYVHQRAGDGPMLLMLHGFPSSSYDFRALLDVLPGRRALLYDCLGFGLSEKPADHTYTLGWQADAARILVQSAGSPPVFLVAHNMGTSVATELMARDLRGEAGMDIQGALLFNGSILLDRSRPLLGQRVLRSRAGWVVAKLTGERLVTRQLSKVFSAAHPLEREEARDQWSLIAHNGGHRIAHRSIRYMAERERFVDRWHGAVRDWPGKLTLAWALDDPVATTNVLEGLRELRPGVPVRELPGLGHYPQIEDPAATARIVAEVAG